MALVDRLVKEGVLKTPAIIKAFREIKRADFLARDRQTKKQLELLAEADEALPIGYAQTISQPLVVAFMLELLAPKPGEKILDIGSGSGWTTALLAHIVSAKKRKKGKVIAVERIPELKKFGEANAAKYEFVKSGVAEFFAADASGGFPQMAPYDKILASAQATAVPDTWLNQLKTGGRIVAPVNYAIWTYEKKAGGGIEAREYPGFVFVPLVSDRKNKQPS